MAKRQAERRELKNETYLVWYLDLAPYILQICKEYIFIVLSRLVYGILLSQPKQTNTHSFANF
jgi:hypothetical protein